MPFDFLILSIAPIPLKHDSIIEGAGIRAWNLADGLSQWNKKILILYPDAESTPIQSISPTIFVKSYENLKELDNWKKRAKSIIFHGSHYPSLNIIQSIDTSANVVIADMYVPIQIEYAARILDDSGSYDSKQNTIFSEMTNEVIGISDYILCAGSNQKQYYKGVVSSKLESSAKFIFENRILDVPHGFHSTSKIVGRKTETEKTNVLFFGAFYPWIENSISIQIIKKLAADSAYNVEVVGTINPFIGKQEKIQKKSLDVTKDLIESGISIREWVPYESLYEIYKGKDLVISLNSNAIESELSWRTRSIDAIRFGVPILTNGGDQISNKLSLKEAAIIIKETNAEYLVREIKQKLLDREFYQRVYSNLITERDNFSSMNSTKILSEISKSKFQHQINLMNASKLEINRSKTIYRLKLIFFLLRTRQYFLFLKITKRFVSNSIQRNISKLVFYLGIGTKKRKPLNNNIQILTPRLNFGGAGIVASDLKMELEKLGTPVEMLETYMSRSLVYQFKKVLQKSNIVNLTSNNVILNTVDHGTGVLKSVFSQLKDNPSMKLIWYVHEDQPQIWLDQVGARWLVTSLNDVKSQILIAAPSKGTLSNLLDYFSGFTGRIDTLMYPVPIPTKLLIKEKDDNNFSNLRFYISGATHDSRKNHRIAIKVFSQVKKFKKDGLRDFELVFIGIGEDSYSSETNRMGYKYLGENYVSVPKCNRDEALAHMNNCHIAICISEFEALPRYVSEGLFLGHPVLRNDCSGLEEQMNLWDHTNGWLVDQVNEKEFTQMILEILNPNVTSDHELNQMRKNSRIKANLLKDDFENSLRKIEGFFQGTNL
jgi:glycosyltransferase involved in cell wall biosynthesis